MQQRLAAPMSSVTYRAVRMPWTGRSRGGPSSSPSSKIEQRHRGCGIDLTAPRSPRFERLRRSCRHTGPPIVAVRERGGVRRDRPDPESPSRVPRRPPTRAERLAGSHVSTTCLGVAARIRVSRSSGSCGATTARHGQSSGNDEGDDDAGGFKVGNPVLLGAEDEQVVLTGC